MSHLSNNRKKRLNKILYEFDMSLDNYDDRLNYVNEHKIGYLYSDKLSSKTKGKLSDSISRYLINSKDCESNRNLEYSFYDSDQKYNAEYVYKKKEVYQDKDRDFQTEDDFVVKSVLTDFNKFYSDGLGLLDKINSNRYESVSELINRYISNNAKSPMDIRKLFHLIDVIDIFEDVETRVFLEIFIDESLDKLVDISKDNLDIDIIGCLVDSMNDTEISKKLNVPRRTISYRVNRMSKKMFDVK